MIYKIPISNIFNCCVTTLLTAIASSALAGSFAPAANQSGTTAIHYTDANIVGWATGFSGYDDPAIFPASDCQMGTNLSSFFQTPSKALHHAGDSDGDNTTDFTFDIVSLGRGGCITLTFDNPITNGDGFDFAIFENGFYDTVLNPLAFLELAWVEVSSNGIDFVRFPAFSETTGAVGSFESIVDATNLSGFAGKYVARYGTPFDLNDLTGNPNLDLNAITHVRIIDIIGNGFTFDNFSPARRIYDPFPTADSAGFDLDAVAVMHFAEQTIEENVPIHPLFIFLLIFIFAYIKKSQQHH